MIEKLEERKEKERCAISRDGDNKVSDQELFRQLGNKIKVAKK